MSEKTKDVQKIADAIGVLRDVKKCRGGGIATVTQSLPGEYFDNSDPVSPALARVKPISRPCKPCLALSDITF